MRGPRRARQLSSSLDRISAELVDHDDLQQFIAGVDIILAGVAALSAAGKEPG